MKDNAQVLLYYQAIKSLRERCESSLEHLWELRNIHLLIDSPTLAMSRLENDSVLRLRKVLLHVQAVTSWKVRTYTPHEIAPDIRAAMEQLRPIVREHLNEKERAVIRNRAIKRFERTLTDLDSYCHPTPAMLINSISKGGLRGDDTVGALAKLYLWLTELTFHYGIGLEATANILDPTKVDDVKNVTECAEKVFRSTPLKKFLALPFPSE